MSRRSSAPRLRLPPGVALLTTLSDGRRLLECSHAETKELHGAKVCAYCDVVFARGQRPQPAMLTRRHP